MDELRLSAVATRVVAWHNRHPLARRISASQVHAIGYVALPFTGGAPAAEPPLDAAAPPEAAPAGGTLRERAQKRARQQQESRKPPPPGAPEDVPTVLDLAVDRKRLKADFSEDFIDPLSPREVARFALRHGLALARAPADGPLRRVRADAGGATTLLFLLTAVIETGTRKSRVLIGAGGDRPAVLGRRVLGRQRVAAAALPLAASAAAAAWWLQPAGTLGAPQPAVLAHAAAASAPASAPGAVHAAASGSAHATPHASAPATAHASAAAASAVLAAASAAASAPAPAGAASMPLDAEPHLGKIELPSIRPHFADSLRKKPPPQEAAAPGAPPAAATAVAAHGPAAQPAAHAPVQATAPPAGNAFAVSSRLLRTRAEADQVRVAMKSLLAAISATGVKVDVMPEGEDFRVVGMPFPSRAAADQARALLVSRGMRVEVLAF